MSPLARDSGQDLSDGSSSSEVKWQVAMWALLPLALGAMTQPTGRVFDHPGSLAFWLRSSPFVCVGDMVGFVFSVLSDYVMAPALSLKHFRAELAWRFQDQDFRQTSLTEAGRSTLTKWTLMILGGIPFQTIKLFAMRGIPFTKSIAMAFFFPQVVGEILYLSAVLFFTPGGIPEVNALDIPSRKHLLTAGKVLKWTCHLVQSCVFCMIVSDLGHQAGMSSNVVRYTFTFSKPIDSLFLSSLALYVPVISYFNCSFVPSLRLRMDMPGPSLAYYAICVGVCMAMCCCIALEEHVQYIYQSNRSYSPAPVMSILILALLSMTIGMVVTIPIAVAISLAAYWGFESCISKFAATRTGRVLGVPEEKFERDMLSIFFLNFTAMVVGYCYYFDSRGTFSPSWIGVLG